MKNLFAVLTGAVVATILLSGMGAGDLDHGDGNPPPRPSGTSRVATIPDAATLIELFDRGRITGNHRPAREEWHRLQDLVDDLNAMHDELVGRKHRVLTEIALARIDSGEEVPSQAGIGNAPLPRDAIGGRLEIRDGDLFHVAVKAGEDPELDSLEGELEDFRRLARELIQLEFTR